MAGPNNFTSVGSDISGLFLRREDTKLKDSFIGEVYRTGKLSGSPGVSSPVLISSDKDWVQIGVGGNIDPFIIMKKKDNSLWSLGINNQGQLGLSDLIDRTTPTRISGSNWKSFATSSNNTVAVKADGTLWVWGNSPLATGDTLSKSVPTQVGSLTVWKDCFEYSAIRTDGSLWVWGINTYGQLGLGNTITVSSPVQVGTLTNWEQVSRSGEESVAIKTDGTLWSWGRNLQGGLGLGDTSRRSSPTQVGSLTNWKQVSSTGRATLAIKTDGTLWAWGANGNYRGQLGLGDNTPRSSPVQVGSLTNWKEIDANPYIVTATKTDGTVWAWGTAETSDGYTTTETGGLGLGDTSRRSSPTQVGSLTNWKQSRANNNTSTIFLALR